MCNKGITQFYLPSTRHPLAGTHYAYPRMDGQAELTWWLVTYRDKLNKFKFKKLKLFENQCHKQNRNYKSFKDKNLNQNLNR